MSAPAVPPTQDAGAKPAVPQTSSAPKAKPFPSISGSCLCNTVRYRLLTSPLFCYACHCPDCKRITGSAFGLFLQIETYNIQILSQTRPVFVSQTRHTGVVSKHVECPKCKIELWGNNGIGAAIADLRVGSLDFPGLFEPDIHSFVESKVEWLTLPEGAQTVPRDYDYKDFWPKSSLKRLDICLARVAEATQAGIAKAVLQGGDDAAGDGEKTPTAVEFGEGEAEDDEAFEKRFVETEKKLQERLEKLRAKLEEEEGKNGGADRAKGHTGLESLTSQLNIADSKASKEEGTKEEIKKADDSA
ncbi:Mss4-like protein [Paraphoma chrysanthemicola]|nr:Mss4-like protein [Paraphoma chrysanthemicola]